MQVERDVINRLVLPALNDRFSPYRIQIRLIDLRWGINTEQIDEDMREQHILNVCFQEIDRSRPFFIGLLGHRYGWVPSASQIIRRQHEGYHSNSPVSVTELEILYGALFNNEGLRRSVFCVRDRIAGLPDSLTEIYEESDVERQSNIERLRTNVRQRLVDAGQTDGLIEYAATWKEDGIRLPEQFATELTEAISTKIREEFDIDFDGVTDGNAHFHALMCAHMNALCTNVIKRDVFPSQVIDYKTVRLDGPDRCGKSVCLAAYALELEERDDCLPLYYATDMDTECHNPGTMLNYFCYRLSAALGRQWEDIADSISDEKLIFGTRIKVNTALETLEHTLSDLCRECDAGGIHPVIMVDTPENITGDRYRSTLLFANDYSTTIIVCGNDAPYNCALHLKCGLYTHDEASDAIDTYFRSNVKELHKSAKDALLRHSGIGAEQHFPGWLALTMYWLANINADDFARIAELDCDSDESKIEHYLLDLINSLPVNEGELLEQFVLNGDSIFDRDLSDIALTAFALSPYGIEERELAAIAGKHWDPLGFARFRRWLAPFISESPALRSWHIKSSSVQRSLAATFADKTPAFYDNMIRVLMDLPPGDPVRQRDLPFYAIAAGNFTLCASLMASPTEMTGEYFSLAIAKFPADALKPICRGIISGSAPEKRPAATVFLILMILLRSGLMPMRDIIGIAVSVIPDLMPESYGNHEYSLTCLSCLWTELSLIARHYGTEADSISISEALLDVGRVKYRRYPSFDSKQSLYKGLTAMAQHYMQTGDYERSMALYNELAELSSID